MNLRFRGRRVWLQALWMFLAFSSSAHGQMWSVHLAVGDLDGDEFEDIVLANPNLDGQSRRGEVHVVSGRTGRELWRCVGIADRYHMGIGVAVVPEPGGSPTVCIAARDELLGVLHVEVRRGADGTLIRDIELPPSLADNECSLAPLSAVGEQWHDFLVVGRPTYTASVWIGGRISLVSIDTGEELAVIQGFDERGFLGEEITCGDFDGDCVPDLAAVSSSDSTHRIAWYGGPGLHLLDSRVHECDWQGWGRSSTSLPDANGMGRDQLIVGCSRITDTYGDEYSGTVKAFRIGAALPLLLASLPDIVHYGPLPVGCAAADSGKSILAISTPWARWLAGAWSVMTLEGEVLAQREEKGLNDYCGAAMAFVAAPGERRPRLVVVNQRLDPDPIFRGLRFELEAWGGERWETRLWCYSMEPRNLSGGAEQR